MNTAEYLIKRLEELGINHFFGVSNDYNFSIIDVIENNPKTDFVACTNVQNAGFAADGYARERGCGAIVTTYGSGELNAVNAIAGSFAENVPVVHIVGMPPTKLLSEKTRIHYNLQEAGAFIYKEIFKNITATTTFLNRDNAKVEIDRVLKVLQKERKPVYIAIPADVVNLNIADKAVNYEFVSDKDNLEKVVNLIIRKINNSKNPVILGDILIKRFNSEIEYRELVEKSGIPTTNFLMGKNIADEELSNNLGTCFAKFKNPIAQKYLAETDCLIAIGVIYTDLNSFGLNLPYKINSHIAIYGNYTYIDGIKYEDVKMSDVLERISEFVEKRDFSIDKIKQGYEKKLASSEKLTSEYIYPRLQEFYKENDLLILETSSSLFGVIQSDFPKSVKLMSQVSWASEGWATSATLGASLANPDKRVILITGEGAHQASGIEIANFVKHKLKPIIIVINNEGYSLKRLFSEDFDAKYNDAIPINYSKFARVFNNEIWSVKVETQEDFDKALKVTQIIDKLCYIELSLPKEDIPELLKDFAVDFKKHIKESSSKVEESFIAKIDIKKSSSQIKDFATKVHESLKE